MNRTLNITGKGNVSVKPDIIILSFEIDLIEMEYGATVDKLNERVESLRKIIVGNGIPKDNIKTKVFSISTETEWDKKKETRVFVGFRARHDLELEIPFDNVLTNTIIRGIARLNENIEFRVSFGVKDKDKYQSQLIENAIENALEHAKTITKATGVILKEILNIDFSYSEISFRSNDGMCSDNISLDCNASMPDLNPSDIKADKTITITWRIE
jgi:uncharacterized protein YggE